MGKIKSEAPKFQYEVDFKHVDFDYRSHVVTIILNTFITETIKLCVGLPEEQDLSEQYRSVIDLWKDSDGQMDFILNERIVDKIAGNTKKEIKREFDQRYEEEF